MATVSTITPVKELIDLGIDITKLFKNGLEITDKELLKPIEQVKRISNDKRKINNIFKVSISKPEAEFCWIHYNINID